MDSATSLGLRHGEMMLALYSYVCQKVVEFGGNDFFESPVVCVCMVK